MTPPKTVILIGAGDRGQIYAAYAKKNLERLKVVAVAEPRQARRERITGEHGIEPSRVFESWEEILDQPRMADGAIIATQDTMHVAPAVKAMDQGYHVLLEKPMALTLTDCLALVETSKRTGRTLNVCHLLRYTDFFLKIKAILDKGLIGDVHTIFHAENLAYYHMAHSFVRGNWRSSAEASPMILAKCCHDMDIIAWFAGARPRQLSSFGSLSHFKPENAPDGAPARCTDDCPAEKHCKYNAIDTYLYGKHIKLALTKSGSLSIATLARFALGFPRMARHMPVLKHYSIWKEWPTSTITEDTSQEGIMLALREGPYGRCVYRCDNDQVDHQETIIEFDGGITAILRMHGHSEHEGRTLRIDGSKGTLKGTFGGRSGLEVHIHAMAKKITFPVKSDIIGHAEGDYGIMENFVHVLNGGKGLTDAAESLLSHMMAFAAHKARIENKVVEFTHGR